MSRKVLALVLPLFLAVGACWAQSVAGMAGISGVVRDPSGAVVPGAKVIVATEGQGVIRTVNANEAGVFAAPALTPASGYKSA
jgi:hypothetical protein